MNDAPGHIIEEVLKLIKQKDHLQELVIRALEDFNDAERGMAAARHSLLRIFPEFNHLHTRLKELESLTRPEKAANAESDLDLPAEYYGMSLWAKVQYHFTGPEKQTAPEILSKILEAEPSVSLDEELRRKMTVNLYATLNSKYKLNEITREKVNGEFFYTLERKEHAGSI